VHSLTLLSNDSSPTDVLGYFRSVSVEQDSRGGFLSFCMIVSLMSHCSADSLSSRQCCYGLIESIETNLVLRKVNTNASFSRFVFFQIFTRRRRRRSKEQCVCFVSFRKCMTRVSELALCTCLLSLEGDFLIQNKRKRRKKERRRAVARRHLNCNRP
jgi:hypothetical protein